MNHNPKVNMKDDKIEYIAIDYMINYFAKCGIECPCCKNNIKAEDICNIPLLGTNQYYTCKNCGVKIEKMIY